MPNNTPHLPNSGTRTMAKRDYESEKKQRAKWSVAEGMAKVAAASTGTTKEVV